MTVQPVSRRIFVTGGFFGPAILKYVSSLTNKATPNICYIPTASADNPAGIARFFEQCVDLGFRPSVLRAFINSSPEQKSFEEILMDADVIFVGGGSTLNLMAIWKAQGIDEILRRAYERGAIMCGGSAGSLCWFTAGPTDSRPKELSLVDCLGWLPHSHCPHYHSEPSRLPFYQSQVAGGNLGAGYACDDKAGLLFKDERLVETVAADDKSFAYYVSMESGKISEEKLKVDKHL